MAQFLGFGSGSDGDLAVAGSSTDAPIDSSCSGTINTKTLSATNASFAAGQMIVIYQTRGNGAGNWEKNKIESYSSGTITTVNPLSYGYSDSGNDQAQVLVVEQNSAVNISGTLTAKAWDGDVGGLIVLMATGTIEVGGTIIASGKGFRGGAGVGSGTSAANCGEGTTGASTLQNTANGNGGAGGSVSGSGDTGGGGGGHANTGTTGGTNNGSSAVGGNSAGSADLVTMVFGGGGGSGRSDDSSSAAGGTGGGAVILIAPTITISGSIVSAGSTGGASGQAGSGGGAGGSILLIGRTITAGSNLITAPGGAGGNVVANSDGGAGSDGRIAIQYCSLSGSTNPAANSTGGQSYCVVTSQIL